MEDEVVSAEKHTLLQLKAWCTAVGINANGAKASLAARLSQLSEEARGLCPASESVDLIYEVSDNVTGRNNESDSDADTIAAHNVAVNVADKVAVNVMDKVADKVTVNVEDTAKNVAANAAVNEAGNTMANLVDNSAEKKAYYKVEDNGEKVQQRQGDTVVEVTNDDGAVRVQKALARKCSGTFGDLLTRNSDAKEKNGMSNGTVEDSIKMSLLQREIELLKLQKAQLEREKTISKVATEGVAFETLKDVIPAYDGGDGFKAWHNQLLHLREVVQVNDAVLGVVIHTKLKGAALAWYNAKPMFPKKVDELLREMESVFGAGESKLDRRRKFEKRMWSSEESFANYFNDKCLLGGELNLGDEELADYLIEGIPDRQLRNQARLQNFTTANDVLRAFRSISLPEHTEPKQRTVERMRCYNCNCSGHYAKDCRKPKREAGSCFACGQLGHYAAECKQHKKNKNTFNV
ncbi:uncharacterized protein LOC128868624 [Anastrepha ludens]|uniref:uncharacterized protein LOC128868624 n=1 Tax=Anastrepha ludens TaxID=28586 RepID=UPI0023B09453|nr:uncharacterized protein LOC128868624 [Anastrepha ludens]